MHALFFNLRVHYSFVFHIVSLILHELQHDYSLSLRRSHPFLHLMKISVYSASIKSEVLKFTERIVIPPEI